MFFITILKKTITNWLDDDPFTQSAAAAYYAVFSLPGLLIIIMAIAAIFFDQSRVENEILGLIRNMLGGDASSSVKKIVEETQQEDRDFWAMIAGAVTLAFGATGLFVQLQRSLNLIWDVEISKKAGWLVFLRRRLASFSLILMVGFLLLVSLSLTAFFTAFGEWLATQFSPEWAKGLMILSNVISFLLTATLFALIFKILPDAHVAWTVAFYGGLVSAALFSVGEYAMNFYFELAEPQSSFGAAGSVILVMLWVSYSCLILLIGAEFSKTYTHEQANRHIPPPATAKKN
ncbi:YihY/virulence factor BrkB family protein [Sneathiella sp.]|uniref:YihY/virulence factor BrkB family protein n=1 Tax=Sneathiella sp. TaxID=1964365 RepID=UPI0026246EF4|nr:YihY/virulence factor BrkB family protein [Sneathiella sp.]MDF2368221.1 YihY/virulence factor BrkB family protein [Sneathiella sp.]